MGSSEVIMACAPWRVAQQERMKYGAKTQQERLEAQMPTVRTGQVKSVLSEPAQDSFGAASTEPEGRTSYGGRVHNIMPETQAIIGTHEVIWERNGNR